MVGDLEHKLLLFCYLLLKRRPFGVGNPELRHYLEGIYIGDLSDDLVDDQIERLL